MQQLMQPTPLYVTDLLDAFITRYNSDNDYIEITVTLYNECGNEEEFEYSGLRLDVVKDLEADGFDEIAEYLRTRRSYFYAHISRW